MLHGKAGKYEFMAAGPCMFFADKKAEYNYSRTKMIHPDRGNFIDATVIGLDYLGPTQEGVTGYNEDGTLSEKGGFVFFPGEEISFSVGKVPLGIASASKKVSPLDFYAGADTTDPSVIAMAQVLQTLDSDSGAVDRDGKIVLLPEVVKCFEKTAKKIKDTSDWDDAEWISTVLDKTVSKCNGDGDSVLAVVSADEAQGNLEKGLNASGIFRKNISKTEDLGRNQAEAGSHAGLFPRRALQWRPVALCRHRR